MKVAKLEGAALDFWVHRALGNEPVSGTRIFKSSEIIGTYGIYYDAPPYHNSWYRTGPIIEKENIRLDVLNDGWCASGSGNAGEGIYGSVPAGTQNSSPLIAALRWFVFSKFGETVADE